MLRNLLSLLTLASGLTALAQGGPLNILFNVQHATCGNATGGIVASVWGGSSPYTLVWTPTPSQGQGTTLLTDVLPGTYTLTVTDNVGNELSREATVILTPDLFQPITDPPQAWSCAGACDANWNYYVPLSGATMPYTVTFDPAGPGGGASPNGFYFNSLCPGETYEVTVSDANGCTGTISGLDVVGPMNPEIVSLTVSPACPGGSNGGFVVEFTDADSVVINAGQSNGTQNGNTLTATNLAAGTYLIYVSVGSSPNNPPGTSGQWCSQSFQIDVPESTDPCGSLSGVVYADLDGDCTQGAADAGMPFRVITVQPGDHHLLTDANGLYASEFFYGSYSLEAAITGYDALCPSLPAPITLDAANTTATIDLAMDPLNGPDAFVTLNAGIHRPGFPVTYTLTLHNDGPYAMNDLTVGLSYDPLLTFTSASGSPVSAGGGNVEWAVSDLAPFSTQQFIVHLAVPPTASLIGTVVNSIASISSDAPDSDPANDSYGISRTITGAYDPNDKLASTSSRLSNQFFFLDADQWIDYTIRFQNTGTAEAINVHLTDTISPLLNLGSLQILGASHAFTAQLLQDRVLRFDFAGIMLPDSATDLLGSQGFASFRLRPAGNLLAGSLIENNADIFFDFNEPVRTNTVVLQAEFNTGVPAASMRTPLLAPNPVQDVLTVALPAGTSRLEIIASDGRIAHSSAARDNTMRISVAQLPAGLYTVRCMNPGGMVGSARFVRQ